MPKPSKQKAKPFTLRLTAEERHTLEREAQGLSLNEYIRLLALSDKRVKRRTRGKHPVKDHKLLAQFLGELGGMRVANNLNQLAKAANNGNLVLTPETQAALMEACADIRMIKSALMQSLGRE